DRPLVWEEPRGQTPLLKDVSGRDLGQRGDVGRPACWAGQCRTSARRVRPIASSTALSLSSRTVGLPCSSSITNLAETPASSATSTCVRPRSLRRGRPAPPTAPRPPGGAGPQGSLF